MQWLKNGAAVARVPQRLALEDGDDREPERLLASRTCERRTYEHALVLSLKAESVPIVKPSENREVFEVFPMVFNIAGSRDGEFST